MRRASLLAVLILLLTAAAVSAAAPQTSPAPATCQATASVAAGQATATDPLPPLFLTNYLCGTCSGACSGILTGAPCTDGGQDGICLGIMSPNGTRARCLPGTGTGYACTCSAG